MRRRSHSSHFLTEGDEHVLAERKTMDVRRGGGVGGVQTDGCCCVR